MEDKEVKNIDLNALRQQWGIPDWHIESEYAYTSHDYPKPLINDQLRWEFLRRNKEYRISWQDIHICRSIFGLIEPIDPTLRGDQLNGRTVLFIDSVMRGSPISMAAPPLSSNKNEFIKQLGEFILDLEENYLVVGFNPFHPIKEQ